MYLDSFFSFLLFSLFLFDKFLTPFLFFTYSLLTVNRLATVGFGNAIPTNLTDLSLTPAELEHARLALDFQVNGTSYFNEHGQRGSTISAALQSSPLALLAWYVLTMKKKKKVLSALW